ncbi:sulfotransferase family protein [Sphaerisporangium melleum]|uniref:Sulfotransferase family protein n=1 Tax=Sphaerisporangium melleum TaxID=321316 RepID=A0A917QX58_9ACTN|nr:sulfotransferase family protein [Sphaerisporangium melleum]GGK73618.1 sulfotransferase family protein [Sphaerisporangium melleum]GII70812.1 sulfotransferase family protein [Sphaerisporangium melleum]
MRVIGAGFGRTGTLTLKTALERLGLGPCHHMTEVLGDHRQIRRWLAVAESGPAGVDWDDVLAGYRSCVDWPAAAYWRELATYYPEAKVVLTVRDPQRWLDSMNATILTQRRRGDTWQGKMLVGLSSLLGTDFAAYTRMVNKIVDDREFDGRMSDPDHLVQRFQAHIEEVKATIPPERLLVFEAREGWEPLCAFLGVPVPDEPFPRVNDAADFHAHVRSRVGPLLLRRG